MSRNETETGQLAAATAPDHRGRAIILAVNRMVTEGMTPDEFKAQFAREYAEVQKQQLRQSNLKLY